MKQRLSVPAIISLSYVAAWIVGLSLPVPSLSLTASGAEVIAALAGHRGAALSQYLLVEGLTGVLLIALPIVVGYHRAAVTRWHRVFVVATIIAGGLSLIMCLLGVVLLGSALPHGTIALVERLSNTINRLDGPKMALLAVMAVAGARMTKLPRWLTATGYILAVALIVSGISYGFLVQSLVWSVYISGILLLVWVGAFGVVMGRKMRVKL